MVVNLYINELKYRLFYIIYGSILCFIVSYCYAIECFYVLAEPYCRARGNGFFLLTNVFEILLGYIKIGVIAGLLYFILLVLINSWLFLVSVLYREHSNQWIRYLCGFILVSWSYIVMVHQYILQWVYTYIIRLSDVNLLGGYVLDVEPRMINYIELTVKLLFIFYLVFIIPLVLFGIGNYIFKNVLEVLGYRVWFYLFLLFTVVTVLPPDLLLHGAVFLVLCMCLEGIVFMLLLIRAYKVKLRIKTKVI